MTERKAPKGSLKHVFLACNEVTVKCDGLKTKLEQDVTFAEGERAAAAAGGA